MSSRMNEDLAWLRLQDMQREAENRRLTSPQPTPRAILALRRLILRTVVRAGSREPAAQPAARPTVENRHHA